MECQSKGRLDGLIDWRLLRRVLGGMDGFQVAECWSADGSTAEPSVDERRKGSSLLAGALLLSGTGPCATSLPSPTPKSK